MPKSKKPTKQPDTSVYAKLAVKVKKLRPQSSFEYIAELLADLQREFHRRHNPFVTFHGRTVGFCTVQEQVNNITTMEGSHVLQDALTAGVLYRPPDQPDVEATIYVVSSYQSAAWVGKDREAWETQKHHVWVLVVVHAPHSSHVGKTFLVFDPNTTPFDPDVEGLHSVVSARARAYLEAAFNILNMRNALPPVWVYPGVDNPNPRGRCLTLSFEFLLRLVEGGLHIDRDSAGHVVGVDPGFVRIQRVKRKSLKSPAPALPFRAPSRRLAGKRNHSDCEDGEEEHVGRSKTRSA